MSIEKKPCEPSFLITQTDQCPFMNEYTENAKNFHIFLVCFYEVCSHYLFCLLALFMG